MSCGQHQALREPGSIPKARFPKKNGCLLDFQVQLPGSSVHAYHYKLLYIHFYVFDQFKRIIKSLLGFYCIFWNSWDSNSPVCMPAYSFLFF